MSEGHSHPSNPIRESLSFPDSRETRRQSSFVDPEAYTVSLRKRKSNRCKALEETSASVGL